MLLPETNVIEALRVRWDALVIMFKGVPWAPNNAEYGIILCLKH
jgi:hypothetical protein